jgi:hypothetical protein
MGIVELAGARRKIESMRETAPEAAASSCFLLLGSIDFLEGHNDEALMNFRQALKLYKKEAGQRKIFFNGSNGLFFLLALFAPMIVRYTGKSRRISTRLITTAIPLARDFAPFGPCCFCCAGSSQRQRPCWIIFGKTPCTSRCLPLWSCWWSSSSIRSWQKLELETPRRVLPCWRKHCR